MFNNKGGLRESTPKSIQKGNDQYKRGTPKGNSNVLSQHGGDDSYMENDDFFTQQIVL